MSERPETRARTWGEGSYLANCQTNLAIALYTLSLLFCKFITTTAYHLGRYKPSSSVSCCTPQLGCSERIKVTIIAQVLKDECQLVPMLNRRVTKFTHYFHTDINL